MELAAGVILDEGKVLIIDIACTYVQQKKKGWEAARQREGEISHPCFDGRPVQREKEREREEEDEKQV